MVRNKRATLHFHSIYRILLKIIRKSDRFRAQPLSVRQRPGATTVGSRDVIRYPDVISYWWSIGAESLFPAVFEIFSPQNVNEGTNQPTNESTNTTDHNSLPMRFLHTHQGQSIGLPNLGL